MEWSWRSGRGLILDRTGSWQSDGDLESLTINYLQLPIGVTTSYATEVCIRTTLASSGD